VVVGGGFAGLAVVRHLRREFDVTLIDRKEYFEFTPGMPRPYADPSYHGKLVLEYAKVCEKLGANWMQGRALEIQESGQVLVERCLGQEGAANNEVDNVPFDYCVVAAGCEYGALVSVRRDARPAPASLWVAVANEDMDERSLESRQRYIEKEFKVLSAMADKGDHVCIIGAGLIGLELAAEFRHAFPKLQLSVVDPRSSCCPTLPKRARAYVQRYCDRNGIHTFYNKDLKWVNSEDAKKQWARLDLPAPERVYICIGMRPGNQMLPSAAYNRNGWVQVAPTLQVQLRHDGDDDETQAVTGSSRMDDDDSESSLLMGGRIFAVGSCVYEVPGLPPLPKNSFPAEDMAALAAKNIKRMERGRPTKSLRWRWLGTLVALGLGPNDGVLVGGCYGSHRGRVLFRGRPVAWLKEVIRWSKVKECAGNLVGKLIWRFVH